ncbi:MAG: deoxyribonuclease V [Dehalococcoidales bacterium]|nr:deoxyribonuclease V [Dehalococcoidales bacterium]
MEIQKIHDWNLDASDAISLQKDLAPRVSTNNVIENAACIAGVDISVKRPDPIATGSIVLLSYPDLEIIEVRTVRKELEFPYIPGLLSFRELPITLELFEELNNIPDIVIVDGQGIAHPRQFGLASHLGLFLGIPTIGCAKSRLCGSFTEPDSEPGSFSRLTDKDEVIGAVVRTKRAVKPVFVSPGHLISLDSAVTWVLNCCRGYRLPEPTRLAHLSAGGNLPGQKPEAVKTIP